MKKNIKCKKTDKQVDLKKQCEEYLNGWKRAQADYQNLVKEFDAKRTDYVTYANANLIMEILPVLDNFKAAFNQIPENEKDSPWVIGFGYIKKQLEDFLAQNGVEAIKTVGEKFDHLLHEAVTDNNAQANCDLVPDSMHEGDCLIVKEIRPGYTLNKKCVQVAKVVVNNK